MTLKRTDAEKLETGTWSKRKEMISKRRLFVDSEPSRGLCAGVSPERRYHCIMAAEVYPSPAYCFSKSFRFPSPLRLLTMTLLQLAFTGSSAVRPGLD